MTGPFHFLISIILSFSLLSGKSNGGTSLEQVAEKPNIIYILADDLGYGELGCYGQEIIETPHIDALAEAGMQFTQHYSGAPVCAPARCVLLTGQHSGHAYIRGNDEMASRGDVWSWEAMYQDSSLEGQRPIPDTVLTIGEVLQHAGYKTGMVGKWGLGYPGSEGTPNRQGFDFFCGYNCQRQAHTYYPRHLWLNDQRIYLENKNVPIHTRLDSTADVHDPASYADFHLKEYAPDIMHRKAKEFIRSNNQGPFFLYYASPIPHLPLQAPLKWVDHYRKKIGEEEPYTGNRGYFPCQYPRATYAAMISYLDEQVGDLVSLLSELGISENTLIIFSSDNGPTYTGGADTGYFDSASPFVTKNGRIKGYVHEGGIRVPMIASWPGKIAAGSTSSHLSAFYDVFPTLCAVAGAQIPEHTDGISFLPVLTGKQQESTHDFLYWEFPAYGGQQAVRMNDWKGIRMDMQEGNTDIELYHLSRDPKEQFNVADNHPAIVREIEQLMRREHVPSPVERFRITAIDGE